MWHFWYWYLMGYGCCGVCYLMGFYVYITYLLGQDFDAFLLAFLSQHVFLSSFYTHRRYTAVRIYIVYCYFYAYLLCGGFE
ncbi:hypothetical protein BZA77DRAFT_104822 [Pyronema omphalodes]|nr:hypothetical protein BZA77DRAFT_104822 [Pyronema omphalodes]